jgi:hypothetical protein
MSLFRDLPATQRVELLTAAKHFIVAHGLRVKVVLSVETEVTSQSLAVSESFKLSGVLQTGQTAVAAQLRALIERSISDAQISLRPVTQIGQPARTRVCVCMYMCEFDFCEIDVVHSQ